MGERVGRNGETLRRLFQGNCWEPPSCLCIAKEGKAFPAPSVHTHTPQMLAWALLNVLIMVVI